MSDSLRPHEKPTLKVFKKKKKEDVFLSHPAVEVGQWWTWGSDAEGGGKGAVTMFTEKCPEVSLEFLSV